MQCRGQRNTYKEGHKIPLQIQAFGGTVALSAVTEEAKGTPGEKADGNFPRFLPRISSLFRGMTIVWRLAYPLDFAHRKITFVVIRAEDLALRHTSEQRPEQV